MFIGNSHTHTNHLPSIVSEIATANGDSLIYRMSAPANYDFQNHTHLEETIMAIQARKWDYIILQESGWRAAWNEEMAEAMTYPYADTLMQMLNKYHPNSSTILFMTQAYKNGVLSFKDYNWCLSDPQVCTYEGMQERVKSRYISLSQKLGKEVSPVGIVWALFQEEFPEIELFQEDGIHANQYGSYLSGLVLYSTLFEKHANISIAPAQLNKNISSKIHKTIDETLFNPSFAWENIMFNWDQSLPLAALN